MRPILIFFFTRVFKSDKFYPALHLGAFMEILHNCSLIIDDIEDDSPIRRSEQAVHTMFGQDISINLANYYYFKVMDIFNSQNQELGLSPTQKLKLYEIYFQEMKNLHIGQGIDIYWHRIHNFESFTEEKYIFMCAHKTGG